ncbi:MAG: putative bifunctional diguanylate cyclase/phosphodiesterase [Bacteroidota bacterium]
MDLRPGIKSRIFGAYVLVLVLGAALAWLVYSAGEQVVRSSRELVEQQVPALRAVATLKLDLLAQESVLYHYFVLRDRRQFLQSSARSESACVARFDELARAVAPSETLRSVRGDYEDLRRLGRELDRALSRRPPDTGAARAALARASLTVERLQRGLDTVAATVEAQVRASSARAESTARSMQTRLVLFAGAIFVVSLFAGHYINRYIDEQTERRRLAIFPERSPSPVLRLARDGAVLYANPAAAELLRATGADARDPRALLPADLERRLAELRHAEFPHALWEYTLGERSIECDIHWLADLDIFHAYVSDISDRKRAQERLIYQAYHDPLTGLPNRRMFEEEFERRVYASGRAGIRAAFLLSGLDRFRVVIESVGHTVGDVLLKAVAARLKAAVQSHEFTQDAILYRLGGDRFGVLLPGFAVSQMPVSLAERILEAMREPFYALGREYHLSLSVGVSIYPLDGQDAATLLRNAETAMQRVKQQGGASLECYTRDMNDRAAEWLALENELRHAEEHGELRLHYQPQVDIASGRVTGAEALLRWEHPAHGLMPPAQFLPLAEESGLIVSLGDWALRTACAQAAAADTPETRELTVAVNITARQFTLPNLSRRVAEILRITGLAPARLELEITETVAMQDAARTIETLAELKRLGVRLAVDDFGTGFSSLAYLRRFPLDKLKIDQSFVRGLPDENDAAITRAVIALGRSLKLRVIAEGVQTREQLEVLREQGCDAYQGDLFSRPLPTKEFAELLAGAGVPRN